MNDITSSFTGINGYTIFGDDSIVVAIVDTDVLDWLQDRLLETINLQFPDYQSINICDTGKTITVQYSFENSEIEISGFNGWGAALLNCLYNGQVSPVIPPIKCVELCTPDRQNAALVSNNPAIPNASYGLVVRLPADQLPIDVDLAPTGQQTMANSISVAIASNQSPVDIDFLPLSFANSAGQYVTNLVVKASAGILYEVSGYANASGFIQIHNTTTLPANTAVPVSSFAVSAGQNYFKEFPRGLNLTTGIVVAFSSTVNTLTLSSQNVRIECLFV